MVGEVRSGRVEVFGELGGVGRSVEELDEYPEASRIRERCADPLEGVEIDRGRHSHALALQYLPSRVQGSSLGFHTDAQIDMARSEIAAAVSEVFTAMGEL